MPRRAAATSIDMTGPFFTHDPRKTFRQNVRTLMIAVAREGEDDVKTQLASGKRDPISGGLGRTTDYVVGRAASVGHRPWEVTAVVSVNTSRLATEGAITVRAAASVVEAKTHAFRKTTGRIRRARSINRVELLKGINK